MRQNRVTPLSELIATPERGLVYGNRGCLHDDTGRIRRRYNGRRWISCQLQFKDWQRGPLLQPGKFTELFFLDEATAFAAGHRPCALCRRADYTRFVEIWQTLHRSWPSCARTGSRSCRSCIRRRSRTRLAAWKSWSCSTGSGASSRCTRRSAASRSRGGASAGASARVISA